MVFSLTPEVEGLPSLYYSLLFYLQSVKRDLRIFPSVRCFSVKESTPLYLSKLAAHLKQQLILYLDRRHLIVLEGFSDFAGELHLQDAKKVADTALCFYAAEVDSLPLMQWARSKGYHWDADICAIVSEKGSLEFLKWCRFQGCDWDARTCAAAASEGRLELLRWSIDQGCPADERACENAAISGNLEILKFAREKGIPWDASTCDSAAECGHFELFKWARMNGCPALAQSCRMAARHGHIELLKWARANGVAWDEWTCAELAGRGDLQTLKWARENGCFWDAETCVAAAAGGHLETLKWAREQECVWHADVYHEAAAGGHLDILKWAKANDCPWDEESYADALEFWLDEGKFEDPGYDWKKDECIEKARAFPEIQRWIEETLPRLFLRPIYTPPSLPPPPEKYPVQYFSLFPSELKRLLVEFVAPEERLVLRDLPDLSSFLTPEFASFSREKICCYSAKMGFFALLKWARKKGCPSRGYCSDAAGGNHLEIVQWAYARDIGFTNQAVYMATINGHLEMVKWLRARDWPWEPEHMCSFAMDSGNLELFKWCRQRRCPWGRNVLWKPIRAKRWDIVKWAIENGCKCGYEWNLNDAEEAARNGFDLLKWAKENGYYEEEPPKPEKVASPRAPPMAYSSSVTDSFDEKDGLGLFN